MTTSLARSARRPRLLFLYPGPVHDLESYFGYRLAGLSEWYRGTVLVTGDEPGRATFGEFEVVRVHLGDRSRVSSLVALRSLIQGHADRAVGQGDPYRAVISYDPLRSGLLGEWIAGRLEVPLIVEINGDHTAPANYSDVPTPLGRWAKRWAYTELERRTLARADGIKLLFPGLLDPFRDSLDDPVVRVIPDLPNLDYFEDLGETKELLFVGHPFLVKGVDLLIEAFKRVADDFPDWRVKILGWFPDPEPVERAIGGHPRIELHPPVGHEEVARHMGRCGIFVLPSRTEAMGRVLLEAMACAKPRIASRVGGIPTVVEDEVDGLLFESEDVAGLADRMARLMGDAALRRRLGARGLQRQREEFTLEAFLERTREFYDAVLARHAVAPSSVEGGP